MDWRDLEDGKEKRNLYYCSREWAELREAVRERAGNRCERCKTGPMDNCHHLTYARLYNERLEDLQAICEPCHQFTHGKSDVDPAAKSEPGTPWEQYLNRCKQLGETPVPELICRAPEGIWWSALPSEDCGKIVAWNVISHARNAASDVTIAMTHDEELAEHIDGSIESALAAIESEMPFAYGLWVRLGMPQPDSTEQYAESVARILGTK